jgi:hypothetical protein
MILSVCLKSNTGLGLSLLPCPGIPLRFFNLLKFTGGLMLTAFLLVLFVRLGFISGSVWVLTAAVGTLVVKIFPLTLVLFAIVGAGYPLFLLQPEVTPWNIKTTCKMRST